jgi:hypothetical protein
MHFGWTAYSCLLRGIDMSNDKPTHNALVVTNPDRPRNAKPWFEKIGAAWPTKDGKGYFVKLFAVPVNGEFVIKEPLEGDE